MRHLLPLVAIAICLAVAWAAAAGPDAGKLPEVYVPYRDLAAFLDPATKAVLMERGEFEKLLAAAMKNQAAAGERELGQVTQAAYAAQVASRDVELSGTMTVLSLSDKPVAVPLVFGQIGLTQIRLDAVPAPLGYDKQGRLVLIVTGKGEHPLTVSGTSKVSELSGGGMRLGLTLPPAVAGKLTLTVGGDLEIHSTSPVTASAYDKPSDRTTAELAIGGQTNVSIVLMGNGRQEDDKAILLGESAASVRLNRAQQTLNCLYTVQVLRRGVRDLKFSLPANWTVTDVACPSLVKWSVASADANGLQELTVRLRTASRGEQALHIQAVASRSGNSWSAPPVQLVGADFQRGYLLVDSDEEIRVRHEKLAGARRENVAAGAALPGMAASTAGRLYYHWGSDWSVNLELAEVELRRASRESQVLTILPDRLALNASFEITAIGRELFDASFDLPPRSTGWTLAQVTVNGASNGFEFRLAEANDKQTLRIELSRPLRAESAAIVAIALNRVPADWDFTDRSQIHETPGPLIGAQADTVSGVMSVVVGGDLDVLARSAPAGLKPVTVGRMTSLGLGANVQLAYTYDARAVGGLWLDVSRRKPRVDAESVGLITARPTGLEGDWRITYGVARAATREFRLLVDKAIGQDIKIETPQYRLASKRILPADANTPAGYDVWQLLLDDDAAGLVTVLAHYDHPMGEGAAAVPLVRPWVENAAETLAVQGSEELALSVQASGASEMDAVDLPPLPAAAWRLVAAYRLGALDAAKGSSQSQPATAAAATEIRLTTTTHGPYAIPAALAMHAEMTTYLGPDGSQRTEAEYAIVNAGLQFLTFRLPAGAQLWSVRVGEQQAKPKSPAPSQYLVSIPRCSQPVAVRLVYQVPGDGSGNRQVRMGGVELAGLKVNQLAWCVVPPPGFRIASQSGMQTTDIPTPTPAYVAIGDSLLDFGLSRSRYGGESMCVTGKVEEEGVGLTPSGGARNRELRLAGRGGRSPQSSATATEYNEKVAPGQMEKEAVDHLAAVSQPVEMARRSKQTVTGRYTLPVELAAMPGTSGSAVFKSLGQGDLVVSLSSETASNAWQWVGFALVGLLGAARLRATAGRKSRFVVAVLLISTLLAMWSPAATRFANGAFYAALLLIPFYLGVAVFLWLLRVLGLAPRRIPAAIVACLLLSACPVFAGGGPGGPPASPQPAPPSAAKSVAPATPAASTASLVVPYEGDPTKAQDSEKVLVPYSTFVELWNLANPDKPIDMPPAAGAVSLAAVTYEAVVTMPRATTDPAGGAEAGMTVTLTADLKVLGKGWVTLPMPIAGLAVVESTFADKPASLQVGPKGMVLALEGGSAGRLKVSALATPQVKGRTGSVQFALPPLPGAVMKVLLPQDDLVLEAPAVEGALTSKKVSGGIEWTVPLTGVRELALRWSPKTGEGEADRTLSAAAAHEVHVFHWGLVGVSKIDYTFSAGEYDRFSILVPAAATLTELTGANVRDYRVVDDRKGAGGDFKLVEVRLYRPASKTFELTARWAEPLPALDADGPLLLPMAANVGRESGAVTLHAAGGMAIQVTDVQGGRRTDLGPAGGSVAGAPSASGSLPVAQYYWPYRPFALTLRLSRMDSRVSAQLDQLVRVTPDSVQLLVEARLAATKGRLFGASFALPGGYELLSALGADVGDWYIQTTAGGRLLHVSFRDGLTSTSVVAVLVRNDPNLAHLAVPAITLLDAAAETPAEQTGRLAVQVAPSLAAGTESSENLKPIAPSATAPWLTGEQVAAVQFAYEYEKPIALTLAIKRQATKVRAEIFSGVTLRPTLASYSYRLRYMIDGSPIDRVSFTLPKEYAAGAAVSSAALRSVTESDAGSGRTRWTVSLLNEVTGVLDLAVNFSAPVDAATSELAVPRIDTEAPEGCRAIVAVQNFSRHEISAARSKELTALPLVEQKDLLPEAIRGSLQYVFQSFSNQWELTLGVKPAKEAARIQAVVDLLALTTVIDRQGQCRCQADLTLQNRSEQYLRIRTDEGLRVWSAAVAAQPVKPVVEANARPGEVLIPLVKTSPGGLPYDVTLYLAAATATRIEGVAEVRPPRLQVVNMPVTWTTWSLRLPEGYRYVRPGGNMSPVAGTAEKMLITIEARLGQLQRLEDAFSNEVSSYRGKDIAKANLTGFNAKVTSDIQQAEQYIGQNADERAVVQKSVDNRVVTYGELKSRLREQKAKQSGVLSQFNDAQKVQELQIGNDFGAFVMGNSVNGGTLEDVRNGAILALPEFVQNAGRKQQESLQRELSEALKPEAAQKGKRAAVEGKSGVAEAPKADKDLVASTDEDRRKDVGQLLDKIQQDQAALVSQKQEQLKKQLSDSADNRITRYYSNTSNNFAGNMTVSSGLSQVTVNGEITGGPVVHIKSRAGTLEFGGNNTNSGVITVNGGTVNLDSGGVQVKGRPFAINGGTVTTVSGGSLDISSGGSTVANGGLISPANGGSININNSGGIGMSGGSVTVSPGIIQSGSIAGNFSYVNTYSGGSTVNAGTLKFNSAQPGQNDGLSVNGPVASSNNAVAGAFSGTIAGNVTLNNRATSSFIADGNAVRVIDTNGIVGGWATVSVGSVQPVSEPPLPNTLTAGSGGIVASEQNTTTTVTSQLGLGVAGGYVAQGTYSLPAELPAGEVELDFAYPGSDAAVSVWAVPSRLIDSAWGTVGVVVVAGVLFIAGRLRRRFASSHLVKTLARFLGYGLMTVVLIALLGLAWGIGVALILILLVAIIRKALAHRLMF